MYGDYHGRFDPARHPVNTAWARAEDGLAWLLSRSWDAFQRFNQAALPEYLDLLADDLARQSAAGPVVVDGGVSTPALLAQAWPAQRLACVAPARRSTSAEVWEGSAERLEMKVIVQQLPGPAAAWARFLEFDERLTDTILAESAAAGLPIYRWDAALTPAGLAGQIAQAWRAK